ncbi:hypothetical protein BGZ50_000957, partial [Haplosporangium sp. Z 11]
MTASQAWKAFAKWFNEKANFSLDTAAMKKRVGRYRMSYYEAKKFEAESGRGLEPKDIKVGRDTIEKQL